MNNPNCDGSGPCTAGEVRLLPLGHLEHHGNLILCSRCFHFELEYRRERNRELAKDCAFDLPAWEQCKIYNQ